MNKIEKSPAIARFMEGNDASVTPTRTSFWQSSMPDGTEIWWSREDGYMRVWSNGTIEEGYRSPFN